MLWLRTEGPSCSMCSGFSKSYKMETCKEPVVEDDRLSSPGQRQTRIEKREKFLPASLCFIERCGIEEPAVPLPSTFRE